MTTALAPAGQTRLAHLRALIESAKPKLIEVLPRHVSADKLARVTLAAIARTPALLECEPTSILHGLMIAARLGLEPDGVLGSAYLVPFGRQATLIPGYRGLIDLARRSGAVKAIWAHVVHARDKWGYSLGLEPRLHHVPALDDDEPGEPTHVYAVAVLSDGERQFEVMAWRQVLAIRDRSKAGRNGPWVTDTEEMARKTVIRRLCKQLPLSVELAAAMTLQAGAEVGESAHEAVAAALDLPVVEAEAPPEPPKPATARLAERLAAEKKPQVTPAASAGATATSESRSASSPPGAPSPRSEPPSPATPAAASSTGAAGAVVLSLTEALAEIGLETLTEALAEIGLDGEAATPPPTPLAGDAAERATVATVPAAATVPTTAARPDATLFGAPEGWQVRGARKPHICTVCGRPIELGTNYLYRYEREGDGRGRGELKRHAGCEDTADEQEPADPPEPGTWALAFPGWLEASDAIGVPRRLRDRLSAGGPDDIVTELDLGTLELAASTLRGIGGRNGTAQLWVELGRPLSRLPTALEAARFIVEARARRERAL